MSKALYAGEAVTDQRGNIGIITEPIKKAGINKGRVSVMWVGGRYEVAEWPEELTRVTIGVTGKVDP